ncbi:hypothetical protein Sp245p_26145 (plasmid) [Azospirillum baldaniorum]|uniref:Putative phage metallopeptidase domain-containing protein n=1 Tax=Azospirillum baldaniorum TaxID=1064539 RepID=A0A9P1JZW5_9PROT|nr:putative metallopeptidase [Azospirillum baldaniorum]AWJ93306.1 hypothetical protein Sp245p_26145 [Azospirillum baldaniorum]TWA78006.1 hypothetical protein FBZ85_106166 [Azospirillum brasilense]CCD02892.1 conserved protein of unknown function [Azospirillum baldaniorum]
MARKPKGEVIRLGGLKRPMPPADLCEPLPPWRFVPAVDLTEWLMAVFVSETGLLANPEHAHLRQANIACLWANRPLVVKMNRAVAMAEMPQPRGNAWTAGRAEQQLEDWFGYEPDFLLTFDAVWWVEADDASACATVEHELFHCGQQRDVFGAPKFGQDGRPTFGIRGHDVEEFVGVVQRYGVGHAAGRTVDLVRAANSAPTIAPALIGAACGTCCRKMA